MLLRLSVLSFLALATFAADLTGKWTGTLKASSNDGNSEHTITLDLKQSGDRISGTAIGDEGNRIPLKGRFEGDRVILDFDTPESGVRFVLKLTGSRLKGELTGKGDDTTATVDLERK